MAKKEKFGKFVLLEEIDASGLGTEYRAAKLGPAGLEKIVTVLRLTPALSANAEGVKLLMDQVKFAAQLQNPNIIKILGIGGKVGSPCWVSYEFFDGKNLKAVFSRCRQDGFPFSVDHALLITSKVSAALEYAHARKIEGGGRYFHGFVTPANVLVSYEGEVRLRGFGYWPARARELGAVSESDALYLAPEQAAGGAGDVKSDMFSVGALLYEMLTGQPLQEPGKPFDPARVTAARLQSPTTDDDAIPKPIREILQKSLAAAPAARYADIQDMRKAVDLLLFSGDFTPTTFNLAFFMHSLFRDDIDRETKTLKDEREATYLEFLTEEPTRPPVAAAPSQSETVAAPRAERPAAAESAGVPVVAAATVAASADAVRRREEPPPRPAAPPLVPPPAAAPPVAHAAPPETQPFVPSTPPPPQPRDRDAAAGFTFHKTEETAGSGSKMPLFVGLGVLVLALGAGAFLLLGRRGTSAPAAAASVAPVSTLSAETAAAMAKVKELEEKLAAIEAEKAAAAAKAEEDARKKVEAQAAARGQAVDPAALQRAQDEARRKSEAEQARKQQEEKKRLEDEQRAAEARLLEERRKEEEARIAAATPATTLPPATQPPAPPPTAPAVRPGALVELSDAGVMAPVPLATPALQYPPIALARRVEGRVEVSVLVDERGTVADAKLTTGAGGKSGLNEAALENARRRRYRPATKDGVPVKVWVPVTVNFVLPR
jgi:TonB family protein